MPAFDQIIWGCKICLQIRLAVALYSVPKFIFVMPMSLFVFSHYNNILYVIMYMYMYTGFLINESKQ